MVRLAKPWAKRTWRSSSRALADAVAEVRGDDRHLVAGERTGAGGEVDRRDADLAPPRAREDRAMGGARQPELHRTRCVDVGRGPEQGFPDAPGAVALRRIERPDPLRAGFPVRRLVGE